MCWPKKEDARLRESSTATSYQMNGLAFLCVCVSSREEERLPLAVHAEALAHRLEDGARQVARVEQGEGDQQQVETVAHVPENHK